MAITKRKLGRGLEALLSSTRVLQTTTQSETEPDAQKKAERPDESRGNEQFSAQKETQKSEMRGKYGPTNRHGVAISPADQGESTHLVVNGESAVAIAGQSDTILVDGPVPAASQNAKVAGQKGETAVAKVGRASGRSKADAWRAGGQSASDTRQAAKQSKADAGKTEVVSVEEARRKSGQTNVDEMREAGQSVGDARRPAGPSVVNIGQVGGQSKVDAKQATAQTVVDAGKTVEMSNVDAVSTVEQLVVEAGRAAGKPIVGKGQAAESSDQRSKITMLEIPIEKIVRNPHQPRQHWDEEKLLELSDSIKVNGLIQPIVVRPIGSSFQLIAGERRLRALRLTGETKATAIVRDADEEQMLQWSIIENIHRADLNPLERAQAYKNYIDRFKITQHEAAERLGENRSSMNNYMRLLDLSRGIKAFVNEGKLTMGHAKSLLGVSNLDEREQLAGFAVLRHWSVRDLEKEIQRINNRQLRIQEKEDTARYAHIRELETELSQSIGSRVAIKPRGRKGNRGKIIIDYNSLDDFDRIQARLVR